MIQHHKCSRTKEIENIFHILLVTDLLTPIFTSDIETVFLVGLNSIYSILWDHTAMDVNRKLTCLQQFWQ